MLVPVGEIRDDGRTRRLCDSLEADDVWVVTIYHGEPAVDEDVPVLLSEL